MNKNNIIISTIVPVYNTERYLPRCLMSLLNQDTSQIEILLIDDGSTDNSGALCDEFEDKYDCVRVIHQQNQGLSGARNTGIKHAKGLYVYFIDSDDYVEEKSFAVLKNEIKNFPDCDVYQVGAYLIDELTNKKKIYTKVPKLENPVNGKEYLKYSMKNGLTVTAWTYIYRTNFLLSNNLWYKVGILHEDEEFTPRALLCADKVMPLNQAIYNYCIRSESITTKKNQEKNAKDLLSTCHFLEQEYKKIDDNVLKERLYDKLVSMNLTAFLLGYKTNKSFADEISVSFLSTYSLSAVNKIKSSIFRLSPSLFFRLENTILAVKKKIYG